jgi:hypothetical protein
MAKKKWYSIEIEFLIEAEDKETARKMVVDHNFAKVLEHNNGWANFQVYRVERVKESELC